MKKKMKKSFSSDHIEIRQSLLAHSYDELSNPYSPYRRELKDAESPSKPSSSLTLTISSPEMNFRAKPKQKRGVVKETNKEYRGRVGGYCTCESYKTDEIYDYLQSRNNMNTTKWRDVVELSAGDDEAVFIFPYGVVVFWGLTLTAEKEILTDLRRFREKAYEQTEYDDLDFSYGDTTKIVKDEVILEDTTLTLKMAISHGVAQSIKLSVYEEEIEELIEDTKQYPEELALTGKINLSSGQISKLMGRIFSHKHLINLHTALLDVQTSFGIILSLRSFIKLQSRTWTRINELRW